MARTKRQAQTVLKHHLKRGALFTIADKRPQRYYPSCLKSEILKKELRNNIPIDPLGVDNILPCYSTPSGDIKPKHPLSQCLGYMANYTLAGYILPLLPEAPLRVHNLHFAIKIIPDCYQELNLPRYKRNQGKFHEEIIGKTKIDYILYASGAVVIHTTCSNYPFIVETEEDRLKLVGFFGQVRAGLIHLLNDRHERIVPDISEWEVVECDFNKDIKISDFLHMNALKIRIKHLDHLLGIYVKAVGQDTVFRVEETKHPRVRITDFITGIFNPMDSVQKELQGLAGDIRDIRDMIKNLSSPHFSSDDKKEA
jgi:hypothetical protein